MMSPDPPREQSQEESLGSGPGGFSTLVTITTMGLDEDMIGDGEHELDFSSQPESETDEDDEEHYRGPGTETAAPDPDPDEAEGNETSHRVRGHYQLLIPFEVQTVEGVETDTEEEESYQPTDVIETLNAAAATSLNIPLQNDSDINSATQVCTYTYALRNIRRKKPIFALLISDIPRVLKQDVSSVPQREIVLSEEKVETIKNVMKGFKLPEASVPVWAKGLSEDSWKSKLVESMESHSSKGDKINLKKS
jgi:hypothetical protein